ncbi:MAG: large conductance mechanosensitive channel protein MscL [Ruminococcaceae bacterium]|nr:large conductance mechanosensitive channel protein MscL [Oscillospiraceae bacterium]
MGKLDKDEINKKVDAAQKNERKEIRKEQKAAMKKSKESFWSDFKKFVTKGNVLDLAVAMVVATSFNAIVSGLVKNIITPFVTYFTSGVSITDWKYVLKPEVLDEAGKVLKAEISVNYGLWLQSILDFLIIAFSVFVFVRVFNNMRKVMNWKEERRLAAEAEKKKADEKAAADALKAKQAEIEAREAEFYANVKEQSELLKDIRELLKK